MADLSGTELSEEKEAEIELKKRQKRPWEELHKSGKISITAELPETLGFYDISAVRREQRDLSADPSLTRFICTELTRGYFLEHNEAKYTERRERVYTCMRIPKELEKGTHMPLLQKKQPAQVCDMLKGLILVLCFSMMHYVDYSMMYHLIRGQSVIKLYIIYNMLEFVEIKGSVFKKFEKNNLFQMSNSDIKERFTSYVLLLIVCLRNMEQFSWNPDHLWVLFPDVFMVLTSEVAVDIIKHAFITKFNDITADVYSEYRASLAFDLVSSRQKNACTDYSDSVARRMGFIPLPLAVLLIRVVMSSVKVQGALSYTCVFLFYLGLVTLKVLNSIVLLGKSCVYVKRANMEDKLFERPSTAPSSSAKSPSKSDQATCSTPSGESKVEQIPVTPYTRPSSSSSSSVTTQPAPRTDLFPPPPTEASPAAPVSRPATPPAEAEQPAPSLSKEEEEEEEEKEAQGASELKHRTPKKDLLEIDRFTICGNRID
ncbi:hypothetical protein PAMP_023071 [Pampus punctatissimus]